MTTRFFDIEIIDKLPDFVSTKQEVSNLFQKYTNNPSLDISVFEESKDSSDKIFNSYYKTFLYYDDIIDDYEVLDDDDDDMKSIFNKNLNDIKYIYAVIDYPVTNEGLFKLTCKPELNELTYGKIAYAYTIAYQTMYDIETSTQTKYIKNNPFLLNRGYSNGKYGIWGHVITDLVYNGNSNISVYNDEQSVICSFDCDS